MTQFDVHRHKGALKDAIPFVVIVQSSMFDGYRRRVVVPLVRRTALPVAASPGSCMNPEFLIEDTLVVLHLLDRVSMAIDQLGEHVMSLTNCGQAIADALDELLTQSWG